MAPIVRFCLPDTGRLVRSGPFPVFRLSSQVGIVLNRSRLPAIYLLLFAFGLFPSSLLAGSFEARFDCRLDGPGATVLFHRGNEAHASRVMEILIDAKRLVAARLRNANAPVTAYLYESSDEMAQGLQTILRYTPVEIDAVIRVGITEQADYTLHLHPKTAKWGSPLTHIIVDEHIHGVIKEIYGTRPSMEATWIEEGLTSYLAHEVLAEKLADFEDSFPERRFKVAFRALLSGTLPTLDEISTRRQWYRNINASPDAWNNQYALAYFSVSQLVGIYGFEAVTEVLSRVGKGQSQEEALKDVTGSDWGAFERSVRAALFCTGVFHLYSKYTILLFAVLAAAISLLFLVTLGRLR